mmetsp:Transcript_14304/g.41127  ORF Transcript_14304/g.41127 Transcript_14304/m.41127 type:complete len:99 (-) Transcript_14304:670-966(-)
MGAPKVEATTGDTGDLKAIKIIIRTLTTFIHNGDLEDTTLIWTIIEWIWMQVPPVVINKEASLPPGQTGDPGKWLFDLEVLQWRAVRTPMMKTRSRQF